MNFAEIAQALKRRERVSDTHFDKIFPREVREPSSRHWSSVLVSLKAAEFLAAHGVGENPRRILDVGSGAGKFCIVGALSTDARFLGVERRRDLADLSRQLAKDLKIERVKFQWLDFLQFDWKDFDGVYLFNPFHENIDASAKIDAKVMVSEFQYDSYVRTVETKLAEAPIGFRVATYHGFGGKLPPDYRVSPCTDVPELEFATKGAL